MFERKCSKEDNERSAKQRAGTGRIYGPAWVEIIHVDEATRSVTFWAPGNGRRVEITCEWNEDNVMADCPSTLDASPEKLPAVGDQGLLYLSRKLVTERELSVSLKWPAAYASPSDYRPLRIWPVEILVRGTELETGNQFTAAIDALNPELVDPNDTISLRGDRPMTLWVSQRGANRFVVAWRALPSIETLRAAIAVTRDEQASARAKAEAWAKIAAVEELVAASDRDRAQERSVEDFRELLAKSRAPTAPTAPSAPSEQTAARAVT